MKKGTTYALLLLMLVFLTKSCVDPLEQQQPQVKTQGDDPALALSLSCLDAGTKAYDPYPDYPKSETNYNETRLKHIDWFVFLNDPTANATNAAAPAVLHGRKTWPNDGIDITQTTLAESVSMSGYVTKFGTAGSAGGYVYVVANLPDSFTHEEDRTADDTNEGGIKYTYTDDQGTHEAYALTYNDLLNKLNVEANFNRYDADGFLPQESFVMTSGVLHFTLTPTNRTATVQADLTRLAAKISIDVDVAFAFDELETIMSGRDTTAVEYTQTWYPDIDNIQIYLVYGNGRSTLLGTPQSYIDKYFFTYNRYQFKKVVHRPEDDNITVDDPFKYHSIVHHEDPSIPSDRTPSEHLFYNISGTPFYTYPLAWTTGEAHTPFIKVILPWTAYDEDHYPNTTLNEHVDHHYITHNAEAPEGTVVTHGGDTIVTVSRAKTTPASAGTKEFYYKISLPTGNDLKLLANHWLKIKLEIAMLGSLSDDLSTELVGQYYVVKWGDIKEETPELTQGRYLGVARHEYTMSGITDLEIPVNSSHALSATITKREALIDGAWTTTGKRIENTGDDDDYRPRNMSSRGRVTPHGRTSVTFTDALNTTMTADLDCYPLRFTVDIYHTDMPSMKETVTIIQYPSIYIAQKPGGNAMVDGYYGSVVMNANGTRRYRRRAYTDYANYHNGTLQQNNSSNNVNNYVYVPYGRIAQYVNSQQNLTVLTISAFTEESKHYTISGNNREYLITDPRQPSGYSTDNYNTTYPLNDRRRPLVPYCKGPENQVVNYEWGADAAKIMIGNRTTPNFIAPKLIIASRWSRMVDSNGTAENGYDAMERRCATYQEAGYPAGRWRLPTEAEVNFIANMQGFSFIENLFTGNGWVSNGSFVRINGNNVSLNPAGYNGNTARCVYDAWYWGEDPVPEAYSTTTNSYSIYTVAP